jgi:hypothetical protein
VAGAEALVAVRSRGARLRGVFQRRLEIPIVAVRIEGQGHNSPVAAAGRLDIRSVEYRAGVCAGGDDGIECFTPRTHDEFPNALIWIEAPRGVKRAVAGIEVIVPVQNQVGIVLVEQLPKCLSGLALEAGAIRCAECLGLAPDQQTIGAITQVPGSRLVRYLYS